LRHGWRAGSSCPPSCISAERIGGWSVVLVRRTLIELRNEQSFGPMTWRCVTSADGDESTLVSLKLCGDGTWPPRRFAGQRDWRLLQRRGTGLLWIWLSLLLVPVVILINWRRVVTRTALGSAACPFAPTSSPRLPASPRAWLRPLTSQNPYSCRRKAHTPPLTPNR
jgi:hypothetical protein